MLTTRRTFTTVSLLSFLLIILLLHRSNVSPRERWQYIAQNVGIGEWSSPGYQETIRPHGRNSTVIPPVPNQVFPPGVVTPGANYSRILVVPRTRREKVQWLDDELPDIDKAIYVVNDPKAPLHPPKNKGHEVMVYLTYIIDNYENLPDVMIFMHAHRRAWHNNEILGADAAQMVRRLSSERVIREGYMNMRCQWYPGCPDWMHPGETEADKQKTEQVLIAKAWSELFPMEPVPDVLAQPCCSQFALSRERVLLIPLNRFMFYREWLLHTPLKDYVSGRVWEYMWQYVFTGQNSFCPVEHACYCDGYGVCFGGKGEYDAWWKIRFERDKYNKELLVWNQKKKKIADAKRRGRPFAELEIPEPGKDTQLKAQMAVLQKEMDARTLMALERGQDPRQRALEAGRPWREGDGF